MDNIVRTVHNRSNPYVILNKNTLWDSDLSLEAVGLWARLMSRPDDWKVRVSELTKTFNCCKDRIWRILKELIEKGYAYRHQTRNPNGTHGAYEYYLFESKEVGDEFKKCLPHQEKPCTVKPCAVPSGAPNIPNKESTDIPVSKDTPPLPKKREKEIQEKIEVAKEIWLTPKQKESFEKDRMKGNLEKIQNCYRILSEWKIYKEIIGGNDYRCLISWVIKAEEEKCKTKKTTRYQTGSTNSKQDLLDKDSPAPVFATLEELKKIFQK